MRYWMLLWLLFALPVQAVLAPDAAHCLVSPSVSQALNAPSAHGAAPISVKVHGEAQQSSRHASHTQCQSCVLCPGLSLLAIGAGHLLVGAKTPQLPALSAAHSSRHDDVPDKPPKFSAFT